MSSPFDPNQWPAGYGPGSNTGGAGGSGGGDELPPYDDADAPFEDDESGLPADPATGEVLPAAAGEPKRERKSPPTADEQRAAFIRWVTLQLSRVEAYGQVARKPAPWCPEWWKHPEVVQRLHVAWNAYVKATKLQAEGDGMAKSAWWVQHWDHHARIIFDEQYGPFRACNATAGHLADTKGEPLTLTLQPPPDDATLF